jgi:hypothetical protein
VNVVVDVPIRAPEQVQIPSPSSRLVLSQLKESVVVPEDEAVKDVPEVFPVCRRVDGVDDKGSVEDDADADGVDDKGSVEDDADADGVDDKGSVEDDAETDVGRDSVPKIGSDADKTPDTTVENESNQLVEQAIASRLFPGAPVMFPLHDGGM